MFLRMFLCVSRFYFLAMFVSHTATYRNLDGLTDWSQTNVFT